ncbi:MAG: hypothetical protein WCI01_12415 [Chlorobiaceae bacterium]
MISDYPVKSPRKLIEVALPLDTINAACLREKSIRQELPPLPRYISGGMTAGSITKIMSIHQIKA